jgi:hypothetical protein
MKAISRSASFSLLEKSTIRRKKRVGRTRSNCSFNPAGRMPVCGLWAHAEAHPQGCNAFPLTRPQKVTAKPNGST